MTIPPALAYRRAHEDQNQDPQQPHHDAALATIRPQYGPSIGPPIAHRRARPLAPSLIDALHKAYTMQYKPDDRQTDGKTQTAQNPAEPLPNPRAERFCQFLAAGLKSVEAYQKAFPGRRSRKSSGEAASRLYKREDVRNRLAALAANRPAGAGLDEEKQDPRKEIARNGKARLTKKVQPVDGQPLNRELVRKMLLAALSSENPNSATVSAIRAAQDFIAQEQPADSRPGPETIADYLSNGAPENTAEIPRIVSALCKAYRITREAFAQLAQLSMDAEQGDRSAIMRPCDEIPPKAHDDLSSNNNDIGL